ncbi:hypothetical protein [Sulfurospirillum diekertiae]|uniref:hypothetical protein n=1 Tax=Sulfurospirillum diekertiae TaxID=1854492 RepID=UPI000B4C5D35|nr:hypothetical protein [Sulfurospirillum diekertiae]
MRNKSGKNKKILEDHKKVGKKLIPPMMYSVPLQETNYIEELLPEIIWMGLIHDELGYHKGIDIIRAFIKSASDSYTSENYINFSLASNLRKLADHEKEKFVQKLIKNELYLDVSELLAPLVYFYDDSPFSFLNKKVDLSISEEKELLEKLKTSIDRLFDRYDTPSVVAQLNVFYTRVLDGKISFPMGMDIPDFNALIDDPHSDEANKAAGFVRNSVKSEYMFEFTKHDSSWATSFWNQSYKLDKCEFER